MSPSLVRALSSTERPVLAQSANLEAKIKDALGTQGQHFHLLRYLMWPAYRMPVYYYTVGLFEIQIERHTSYWACIFKSGIGFKAAPFVKLSKRRSAFGGLERKFLGNNYHIAVHCLEVHVDNEEELVHFIKATLPLMKWDPRRQSGLARESDSHTSES